MQYCVIEKYSHHFVVTDANRHAKLALKDMLKSLVQYDLEKRRGRFRKVAKRVFAAKNYNGTKHRFHINHLDIFLDRLSNYGIGLSKIKIIDKRMYAPVKADIEMPEHWVSRDHQIPIIDFIVDEGRTKIVTLQTGQGKAQPLDTRIKVPGGWSTMGEMEVGTEVITPDGDVTKVIGVYPQGEMEIFKITFSDGRTTEATEDHLWEISHCGKTTVIDTAKLQCLLKSSVKPSVRLIEPEDSDDVTLPVPPYGMGLLNGRLASDLETHGKALIPSCYLSASTEQRLDLLRGLMDVGGSVTYLAAGPVVDYRAFDDHCAKVVVELVRSLGGTAELNHVGNVYHVSIHYSKSSELFARYHLRESGRGAEKYLGKPTLYVKSVESTGESKPAQCIKVATEDSLYVTDDYIVTHNTYCGLKAGELISERLCVQILGRFVDKWVSDVKEGYGLDDDRIMVIRGCKPLKALLMAMDSEDPPDFDVLIITTRTLQDYIKEYELTNFNYMPKSLVPPEKIYEKLGIGYRIIDEAHMHFHMNFKTDLYTHIPKALYLSATLHPDDDFIKEMYAIAYPPHLRTSGGGYVRYTEVIAFMYQMFKAEDAKTQLNGSYSHTAFEQWLLGKPKLLDVYLEMIYNIVEEYYMTKRKDSQRCLIFAALVDMCEVIVEYIRKRTDDLEVNKYNSDDDYEILISSDICVSTLGSAGTAVDIKDLITCIMTTALSGTQANLQAIGRLRELKNYPDQTPIFIYLVCSGIQKHVEYHKKKKELLKGRALRQKELVYHKTL